MPMAQVNGTNLFYLGLGHGRPCLVMHGGLGFDHSHLRPWVDRLGDALRLIYYDHRGNGRAGRPPLETLTYKQFAADADALRAHLGVDQVVVMGFSAGGAIALHYALAFPQHLSHLILVGAHAAWDYEAEIAANVARRNPSPEARAVFGAPAPATDAEFAQMVEAIMPLYFHRHDPMLSRRILEDVIWSAFAYRAYSHILERHDVSARLGEISAPTLVVVGQDDFITPPTQAERLARGIPRAELVVFEESGHMPYVEEPEAFAGAVRDWLARTD